MQFYTEIDELQRVYDTEVSDNDMSINSLTVKVTIYIIFLECV